MTSFEIAAKRIEKLCAVQRIGELSIQSVKWFTLADQAEEFCKAKGCTNDWQIRIRREWCQKQASDFSQKMFDEAQKLLSEDVGEDLGGAPGHTGEVKE